MIRRAAWAGLVALACMIAPAHAQPGACSPAPPLEPGPQLAKTLPLSWEARDKAIKAQRDWSAPRLSYGACRRAEIDALAKRVNAAAAEINALVDETNAVDKRLRAARTARNNAFRAFAERRNRKPEDLPAAALVAAPSMASPCTAPVAPQTAPAFPDGRIASANAMRRADQAFQTWAAPFEAYVACRRQERDALVAQHQNLKSEYDAAQAQYASYRAAFNTAVARFQTALNKYTAKLPPR